MKRSYRTSFERDENPITEGGKWLNGKKDGIDWADVITKGGEAYGSVTRMAVTEKRSEQATLGAGLAEGSLPEGDYDDPTAVLTGDWGRNQHVKARVFSRKPTNEYFQEVEIRLRSANAPTGLCLIISAFIGVHRRPIILAPKLGHSADRSRAR